MGFGEGKFSQKFLKFKKKNNQKRKAEEETKTHAFTAKRVKKPKKQIQNKSQNEKPDISKEEREISEKKCWIITISGLCELCSEYFLFRGF